MRRPTWLMKERDRDEVSILCHRKEGAQKSFGRCLGCEAPAVDRIWDGPYGMVPYEVGVQWYSYHTPYIRVPYHTLYCMMNYLCMGESSASRPYLYCYFDTDAVERIRIDSEEFIVGFCICRVRIVRSKRLSSLEGTNRDVYPTSDTDYYCTYRIGTSVDNNVFNVYWEINSTIIFYQTLFEIRHIFKARHFHFPFHTKATSSRTTIYFICRSGATRSENLPRTKQRFPYPIALCVLPAASD